MYKKTSEEFNQAVEQYGGRTFLFKLEGETFLVDSGIKKIVYGGGSSGEDKLTIGSAVASYIEVTMEKTPHIITGQEISLFLGMKTAPGIEYVPMGIFKAKKPSVTDHEITFKAYDRMEGAERNYASSIRYPTDTAKVMSEIAGLMGIEFVTEIEPITLNRPDSNEESGNNTVLAGYTIREAIGYIAGLYGKFAAFNREGKLEFKWYEDSGFFVPVSKCFSFAKDENDYVVTKIIGIQGRDNTYEAGSGIKGISCSNPFLTQDIVNGIYQEKNGFSYRGAEIVFLGDCRLDVWDIVTGEDLSGAKYKIPVMELTHEIDGGLTTTVKAMAAGEEDAADSFKGPSTKAMERTHAQLLLVNKLIATKASIEYLETNYIKTSELDAVSADIENAVITNLQGKYASIEYLQTNYATIERLGAVSAKIDTLEANTLTANSAVIQSLQSGVAQIDTIQGEFADYKIIVAEEFSAAKGWMLESSIGDAQISSLNANKLKSGTIDTSLVKILGTDSAIEITGGQILVNNTSDVLNVSNRVIMGKYINSSGMEEYGFLVRSEDGQTVMIDGNGVHNAGITDGAVNNNKIAENAGITGNKLNIDSVVREINGSDETISSTVVSVGDKTLNIFLEEQKNIIAGQGETLVSHAGRIDANEKSIGLKVNTQTYTEDKEGIEKRLQETSSKLEMLDESIKMKVEQTDVDNSINALDLKSRNLLHDSKTLTGNGYGFVHAPEQEGVMLDEDGQILESETGVLLLSETGENQVITEVEGITGIGADDSVLVNAGGSLRQIKKRNLLNTVPDNLVLYEETEEDDTIFIDDIVEGKMKKLDFFINRNDVLQLLYGETVLASVQLENLSLTTIGCTGISLDKENIEQNFLNPEAVFLVPKVEPVNCTQKIQWYSDNEKVATINNGIVTCTGRGQCSIYAICGNHTAVCLVSVKLPEFSFEILNTDDNTGNVIADSQSMRVVSNMIFLPAGTVLKFSNTDAFYHVIYYYDADGNYLKELTSQGNVWSNSSSILLSESYNIRIKIRDVNYKLFTDAERFKLVQTSVSYDIPV